MYAFYMLAYTLHTHLLILAFLWLSGLPPIKASESFTFMNIHQIPIRYWYFVILILQESPVPWKETVACISTKSGCPFPWHFFFLLNLFINRNPIQLYYALLFCPSACQALSPWRMIKGTAKNERSPGKRRALWQSCASKCESLCL